MNVKVMNKEIDYIKKISRQQRVASIGEIIIHELSGGTFKIKARTPEQALRAFFGDTLIYSHKCNCDVVQKCTKVLPIVLCNN